MKIPVQFNVTVPVPMNTHESGVLTVCPFYELDDQSGAYTLAPYIMRGSVVQSQLFQRYAALYDECKCDGLKVALSITTPIGGTGSTFPSLSVYTAWDRKWTPSDFGVTANYPTLANMKAQSSFLASTALNNSITKLTRSCYASDLFEKARFIDAQTANITLPVYGLAGQTLHSMSSYNGAQAPPSFNPCLLVGFDSGSSVDTATDRPVALVVEVMYYITFRNPKFGGAASTRSVALQAIPNLNKALDADDGDMDIDDPLAADVDLDDDGAQVPAGAAVAAAAAADMRSMDARPPSASELAAQARRHKRAVVLDPPGPVRKNAK